MHTHPPPPCAWAPGMAEELGRNLLVYGRRVPKAELFARIDAVDADTVKAVAQRFVLDQDVAVAAMGDTQVGRGRKGARRACSRARNAERRRRPPPLLPSPQFLPDYTWLRRRTFWLRY